VENIAGVKNRKSAQKWIMQTYYIIKPKE
jgi:hypothetical protein